MTREVDRTRDADITHRCPPEGLGAMPCCGRTPFEVPGWHRMAVDDSYVTCEGIPASESNDGFHPGCTCPMTGDPLDWHHDDCAAHDPAVRWPVIPDTEPS